MRAKRATKYKAPKTRRGAWKEESADTAGEQGASEGMSEGSGAAPLPKKVHAYTVSINRTGAPLRELSAWLPVTSLKTGYKLFVPLPIRLIQQIPDGEGGGCIVRGAYGDAASAKESIVDVLGMLNGYALGPGASFWSLAS